MKTIFLLFISFIFSQLDFYQQNTASTDTSLQQTDNMPRFPGCEQLESIEERKICSDKKLLEFVYGNQQYPKKAKKLGVEGIVVVAFTINIDGSVSDIQLMRDVGAGLGEEALRIIRLMQEQDIRWIPGKNGNKNIPITFSLPIKFKLK